MASVKPRLGAQTVYPERYDPSLLVSIPRSEGRSKLTIPAAMYGVDLWTGYELSWLSPSGVPRVAIAEFQISCDSPFIVESKSFKLYLNSLNQARFASVEELTAVLKADLAAGFGAPVGVEVFDLDGFATKGFAGWKGVCLDGLDITCDAPEVDSELLSCTGGKGDSRAAVVEETLYSHLLKSNCPVTGQPDWASIVVTYSGRQIDRQGLLRYIVSFRQHQDFHENCVERIFSDLLARCQPERLSVNARYTRRGGLDINPFRSTEPSVPEFARMARQ